MPEIELKLQVPPQRLAGVQRAMLRGATQRVHLKALYFDTPSWQLAGAGLALRLRREGRVWVQTLKGVGDGPFSRFEHDQALGPSRTPPQLDVTRHAGTTAGVTLEQVLGADASVLGVRYATDVWRTLRLTRQGGTLVELALDQGVLQTGSATQPICELELELKAGDMAGLARLAAGWAQRHGLWIDVRSKSERGRLLADAATASPATRATVPPLEALRDQPDEALRACVRSALEHILPNAAALSAGGAEPEHLHQARVGLRRLSTMLRTFGDWSVGVEERWLGEVRTVFVALSACRDADALEAWLWPALRDAGAPEPLPELVLGGADPGEVFRAAATTRLLLELTAFAHASAPAGSAPGAGGLKARLGPRLARLHRGLRQAGASFLHLDDEARHRARKRLKRLRYGAESVSSLFPGKAWQAYCARLRDAQEALGQLQDLVVAEAMLRQRTQGAPGHWFALGWTAGRRKAVVGEAGRALAAIGKLPKILR